MAKHIWSVVCTQVVTDKDTNNVSYFNVVESIPIDRLPNQVAPGFMVGTMWLNDDESPVKMRVRVLDPKGDVRHQRELDELSFNGNRRYRINLQVAGFVVAQPGTYKYEVAQRLGDEWRIQAVIPVDFVAATEAERDPEAADADDDS